MLQYLSAGLRKFDEGRGFLEYMLAVVRVINGVGGRPRTTQTAEESAAGASPPQATAGGAVAAAPEALDLPFAPISSNLLGAGEADLAGAIPCGAHLRHDGGADDDVDFDVLEPDEQTEFSRVVGQGDKGQVQWKGQ